MQAGGFPKETRRSCQRLCSHRPGTAPCAATCRFPKSPVRIAWLDLLRSVAVLLVLFRHGERAIVQATTAPPPDSPLHHLSINGWVGVDLFLVLSGYLIGKNLLRNFSTTSTIGVKSYLRARILRIVPAYVFVLVVIVAGLVPEYSIPSEHLGRRVLYHLLFLQDYLPANINVVFWSLGVEEKFYLFAPLFLLCLARMQRPAPVAMLLAGLFLLSPIIKGVAIPLCGFRTGLRHVLRIVPQPVSPLSRTARRRRRHRLSPLHWL